jgi:hypothetical protein
MADDNGVTEVKRLEHQLAVTHQQAQATADLARADASVALARINGFFAVAKWIVGLFGVSSMGVLITTLIWGVTLGNRVNVLEISDFEKKTHADRLTRLEETNIRIERTLDRLEVIVSPRRSGR